MVKTKHQYFAPMVNLTSYVFYVAIPLLAFLLKNVNINKSNTLACWNVLSPNKIFSVKCIITHFCSWGPAYTQGHSLEILYSVAAFLPCGPAFQWHPQCTLPLACQVRSWCTVPWGRPQQQTVHAPLSLLARAALPHDCHPTVMKHTFNLRGLLITMCALCTNFKSNFVTQHSLVHWQNGTGSILDPIPFLKTKSSPLWK